MIKVNGQLYQDMKDSIECSTCFFDEQSKKESNSKDTGEKEDIDLAPIQARILEGGWNVSRPKQKTSHVNMPSSCANMKVASSEYGVAITEEGTFYREVVSHGHHLT